MALGVTSDFLYPIVVAVSVITIFLTPYMIRLAGPAYEFQVKHLPERVKTLLDNYAAAAEPRAGKDNLWKQYLGAIARNVLLYGILCIAVCIIGFTVLLPAAEKWIPGVWSHVATAALIIAAMAPFLRGIMVKMNRSAEFSSLWDENRANRAPLVASVVLRFAIVSSSTCWPACSTSRCC